MGKKKSVVLMTLLTIVIVVLSALTVFPRIDLPNSVKSWNPAVMQYDLGMDLGGGYYAYYYPEGVITENEFENNCADLTGEELDELMRFSVKYVNKRAKLVFGTGANSTAKAVAASVKAEQLGVDGL